MIVGLLAALASENTKNKQACILFLFPKPKIETISHKQRNLGNAISLEGRRTKKKKKQSSDMYISIAIEREDHTPNSHGPRGRRHSFEIETKGERANRYTQSLIQGLQNEKRKRNTLFIKIQTHVTQQRTYHHALKHASTKHCKQL